MLFIRIDYSDILGLSKMEEAAHSEFDNLGAEVTQSAYAHIIQEADKKLHSKKGMFIENISIGQEDGVYMLVLDASARWIDDGQDSFNMLDSLLNSPKAKTGKNGKYLVVPFQQNKSNPPAAQQNLIQTIKSKMKDKGLSFGDIEKNADGKPKEGLLHKFDINDGPPRQSPSKSYAGHSKFGTPVQGNTGIPFLQGVRVYQKKIKDNKTGKTSVQRFIGTFRTASESQQGSGRWQHPGNDGVHIFDETAEWVQKEFVEKQAGKILDKILSKIK